MPTYGGEGGGQPWLVHCNSALCALAMFVSAGWSSMPIMRGRQAATHILNRSIDAVAVGHAALAVGATPVA